MDDNLSTCRSYLNQLIADGNGAATQSEVESRWHHEENP